MALTIPTIDEFELFKNETFDVSERERAELFLRMSAALVELRLGIVSVKPETARADLVSWAIMDLAWYIGTSMEDRDAMFSPFSSERIGSYSYSKAQRAAVKGMRLGVPFFDMLLDLLDADALAASTGESWTSSSKIFSTDAEGFVRNLYPDPWIGPVVRREDPSEL